MRYQGVIKEVHREGRKRTYKTGVIYCVAIGGLVFFKREFINRAHYPGVFKEGDIVSFEFSSFEDQSTSKYKGHASDIRFVQYPVRTEAFSFSPQGKLFVGKVTDWEGRFGNLDCPTLVDKLVFLYYTKVTLDLPTKGDLMLVVLDDSRIAAFDYYASEAILLKHVPTDVLFSVFRKNYGLEHRYLGQYIAGHHRQAFLTWILARFNPKVDNLRKLKNVLEDFPEPETYDLPDSKRLPDTVVKLLLRLGFFQPKDIGSKLLAEFLEELNEEEKLEMLRQLSEEKCLKVLMRLDRNLRKRLKGEKSGPEDISSFLELLEAINILEASSLQKSFSRKIKNHFPQFEYLLSTIIRSDLDTLSLNNRQKVKRWIQQHCEDSDFREKIFSIAESHLKKSQETEEIYHLAFFVNELLVWHREDVANELSTHLVSNLEAYQVLILKALDVPIKEEFASLLSESDYNQDLAIWLQILRSASLDARECLANSPFQKEPIAVAELKEALGKVHWDTQIDVMEVLSNLTLIDSILTEEPDMKELALWLFDQIPKYAVHHLQLFIAFPEEMPHSYDGFREPFKELSSGEQKRFREYLNNSLLQKTREEDEEDSIPCQKYTIEENHLLYQADIQNVLFRDGLVFLCMEDGEFSSGFYEPLAVEAMNAWRHVEKLQHIKLMITVRKDNSEIQSIIGIDRLWDGVLNTETKLGGIIDVDKPKPDHTGNEAYPYDPAFREKVMKYLLEKSEADYDIHLYLSKHQKSTHAIFTIPLPGDQYVLVWTNNNYQRAAACHLFLCNKRDLQEKRKRLEGAIKTFPTLRRYLIHNFGKDEYTDKHLQIQYQFRSYLGYVGNVRNNRGVSESFSRWRERFTDMVAQTVPDDKNKNFSPYSVDWDKYGAQIIRYVPRTKPLPNHLDRLLKELDLLNMKLDSISQTL